MPKRSAITIAAGLVSALVAGAAAFSLSFGAPQAPSAAASTKAKPTVRVERRTVTVHTKAKQHAGQARVVTIQRAAPTAAAVSSGSNGSYSSAYGDDSYEGSDHEGGSYSGGVFQGDD